MGKPIVNPIEREILQSLYTEQRLSAIKIANLYSVKPAQIYYLLEKYGIPRRSDTQKNTDFSVNHDYFSKINSEEKAYWLGFLYADGYITCRNQVGLALAVIDEDHVHKFREAIKSTHPVHRYFSSGYGDSEYSKLIFSSEKMVADLQKLGCFQRKSLILKFPSENQVPSQYLKDFVRGYFDGDGSITTGGTNHPIRLKICGTKEFLEGLRQYFETVLCTESICTSLSKRHKDEKNTYQFTVNSTHKILKILDELYGNASVYLDRKYSLYMEKKTRLTVEPIRNGGC